MTLAEEIEYLRAENATLKRALAGETAETATRPRNIWRCEWRLLCLLRRQEMVSKATFSAVYEALADKIHDSHYQSVLAKRLRSKLEPLGVRIRTEWGTGYSMDMANKRKCDRLFGALN